MSKELNDLIFYYCNGVYYADLSKYRSLNYGINTPIMEECTLDIHAANQDIVTE